jgi:dTMP kinase
MAGHRERVNPGRLVAFEGLDGCGKSTQIAALERTLLESGVSVLRTHEPTDGPMGRRIRRMARSGNAVAPEEELAWFVEDRRQHVSEVIGPALAEGRVVLTDRYFLSTVAYQGARGLDPDKILEESEAEFPLPDLAIVLEVDPEQGMQRVKARGAPREPVFEHREFLERVAAGFRNLDRPYVARIDGAQPVPEVRRAVHACVRNRLGLP